MRRLLTCTLLASMALAGCREEPDTQRPNILFAISDDQSWPHASAYGSTFVETPAFDRIAREGVLFSRAFVTSPGCAPSRASIVLGRYPWQNGHAGNHNSLFPGDLVTLSDLLEASGYRVGYTGKGVGPFQWALAGRYTNPAGHEYNEKRLDPPQEHINDIDYAENFRAFLEDRPDDTPFFFWYGATEPHRRYEVGAGLDQGKALSTVEVPPFLPEHDSVRVDLLDYATEIEWFDRHLGAMIAMLEERGELDNTLILVTADNGMPFPAAKANVYEFGIHVPLAARWGARAPGGRTVDDLVSLIDVFSTSLEVAGVTLPPDRTVQGKSLVGILEAQGGGVLEPDRSFVLASRERHSSSRWANLGYPQRAIRTHEYLYIRNFKPERWPSGAPWRLEEEGRLVEGYHDIDWGATSGLSTRFMVRNADDPSIAGHAEHALALRPEEELFDVRTDPGCLQNLAYDSAYADVRAQLAARLEERLRETDDPRFVGPDPDVFESYPRYAGIRAFPRPAWADTMDAAEVAALVDASDSDHSPLTPPDSVWNDGLRAGPWLLLREQGSAWGLYDAKTDPERTHDLSAQMPQVVGQLTRLHREARAGLFD